ncbi:NADPH:quinone reductase [Nocardioides sp. CBS4Y-1]|uniref:NADPH:quinone reductase n=2 Tax=Nocardioides acrostichi TaxID=2784339 RepID=A0A930V2U5_9ACTN|nr:NADPH:quinone reductase [Nocardioides acrostichi]
MRAVVYRETGAAFEVLEVVDRPVPVPGPGEVRVRLERAGVNPTDWKFRANGMHGDFDEVTPGQDGAGTVDAVGPGVDTLAVGDRVWTVLAQHERALGTAAQYTVQPVETLGRLPEGASFDLGASLGVPAVTAHRALTAGDLATRVAPGSMEGLAVLVAGGAGAVGNAAIQLARWAGATVVATVSSEEKAALATAAGAHHVVDYTAGSADDTAAAIEAVAPDGADGVDIVVEVSLADNAAIDARVVRNGGVIAYYADKQGESAPVPVRATFAKNARLQGLILYTLRRDLLRAAIDDVTAAVEAGALRVGEDAGLPLHHYPLEQTAEAHAAVEGGAVGKVLLEL